MVSDVVFNIPSVYILLAIPFLLCIIEICILFLLKEKQISTDKKLKELQDENSKLISNILDLLKIKNSNEKEFIDIEEKNLQLLEKISNRIETRDK